VAAKKIRWIFPADPRGLPPGRPAPIPTRAASMPGWCAPRICS